MTRWIARSLAGLILLALGAWLLGLIWFAAALDKPSPEPDARTDAIVVLTGGSGRLDRGFGLLVQGKAKKLFVSGVHPGVAAKELLHEDLDTSRDWARCCVVLGHRAGNTVENAAETAEWLRQENYHSIRLVTSNYHMRRSLLEFRRVLPPDTAIIPDPVFQPGSREMPWLTRGGERIVVLEYMKFLAAWLRPVWDAPGP